MRNILTLLFFTIMSIGSFRTYGQSSCKDISSQIIALENEQNNSRLKDCTSADELYCCPKEQPDAPHCKRIGELESEYNTLQAKIVLIDSLRALGGIIQEDHNIIKNIPEKNVMDASKSVDDLFYNLKKSKLISSSLNFEKDDFIWKDFRGTGISIDNWIKLRCTDNHFSDFCNEHKKVIKEIGNDPKRLNDLNETLTGLANSSYYVYDNDIEKTFKGYQEYLSIKIDGKDIPYSELETNQYLEKLKTIKELSQSYENSKDPEIAKQIIKLTRDLEDLKVNYTKDAESKFELRFGDFNKKHISEPMSKIKYALDGYSGVSTLNASLDKANTIFENEEKRLSKNLELSSEKFFNESSKECPGQNYEDCLKKFKDQLANDTERSDIIRILKQFEANKEIKDINIALLEMKRCLKEETSISKIKGCRELLNDKLNALIGDDKLESLQEKLIKQKDILAYVKKGSPIVQNNFTLAYALDLYRKECENPLLEKITGLNSLCADKNIEAISQEVIKLDLDTESIILNVTRNNFLKDGKLISNDQTELLTENFKNTCKKEEVDKTIKIKNPLCIAFNNIEKEQQENTAQLKRMEEQSFRLTNTIIKSNPKDEQMLEQQEAQRQGAVSNAFMQGAMGVLGGLPQYYQMHQAQQRREAGYNYQLSQMRKWNNYYQDNPIYNYTNVPGYPHTYTNGFKPYVPSVTNFSGNNSSLIYYNSYDFKNVNFANPRIYNPVGDYSLDTPVGVGF